jgi:hypothetical protein
MLTSEGKFAHDAQSAREGEKACSKCRRWAALADFPPNSKTSSGRSGWCQGCHREAVRAWRRLNRDEENRRRRARTAERRVAAAR